MRKYLIFLIVTAVAVAAASCSSSKTNVKQQATTEAQGHPVASYSGPSAAYIPKAVIYKTNGDYNANVAVTLTADGKSIASYPAPTDITADSEPLEVGDGWLLDRRGGIGANTAFLKYTYAEYSKLPAAPSVDDLKAAIIPDAKVTATEVLPITVNEALSNPSEVKKYIK